MDNLSRLAAKPGVQSTLILSKADGSIIRSSGLLASPSPPASSTPVPSSGPAGHVDTAEGAHSGVYYGVDTNVNTNEKRAEDVAKMVFSFVSGAGVFVEGMDKGDELKLLRVRTRTSEIVIVPGLHMISFSGTDKRLLRPLCRHKIPARSHTRYTSGIER